MYLVDNPYGAPRAALDTIDAARRLSPIGLRECRAPTAHVGMPNYTGCIPVPHPYRPASALVESLNERYQFMDLILTRAVSSFCAQPFRVCWKFAHGVRVHTPDALLFLEDSTQLLIDVTRSSKLEDPKAMAIFVLTAATADLLGWDYQLRTELPTQRILNVRHLWCYRTDPEPEDLAVWRDQATALLWPMPVRQARHAFDAGSRGLAAIWHLLGRRHLFVDLDRPITPDTQLSEQPCTEEEPWVTPV